MATRMMPITFSSWCVRPYCVFGSVFAYFAGGDLFGRCCPGACRRDVALAVAARGRVPLHPLQAVRALLGVLRPARAPQRLVKLVALGRPDVDDARDQPDDELFHMLASVAISVGLLVAIVSHGPFVWIWESLELLGFFRCNICDMAIRV